MKRNLFSLSHYKPMTFSMGELIPIAWVETLPGDTFQMSTGAFIRMLELNTPVMHPVHVRIAHHWVPISLIWDDYADFFTGGSDGKQTPTHPYVALDGCAVGSLDDYLGLPATGASTWGGTINVSALARRAYATIYNSDYRDQQICSELTVDTTSGQDTTTNSSIQRVCWPKDYFTTMREEETLGDEVTIPLTGEARVTGIGYESQTTPLTSGTAYETDGTAGVTYADYSQSHNSSTPLLTEEDPSNAGFPNIRAQLSDAGAMISMGDWYAAQAAQIFQQRRNVYGARYPELIRRAYGVRSRDQRAVDPVYLGGGRATIQFSEAIASDGANTGDLYGHGAGAVRTRRFRKFFDEHGILMSFVYVVPKAVYMESINRKWLRTTKEEYFMKEYQLVGEQAVTYKEAQATHSTPDAIMGYQERYGDYKDHPSEIAGDFNSSLNTWTMHRDYSGDIALNQSWLECNPTTRIFKSTSTDNIIGLFNNSIQARRQMLRSPSGKAM
jgi:hypothetical protein